MARWSGMQDLFSEVYHKLSRSVASRFYQITQKHSTTNEIKHIDPLLQDLDILFSSLNSFHRCQPPAY